MHGKTPKLSIDKLMDSLFVCLCISGTEKVNKLPILIKPLQLVIN